MTVSLGESPETTGIHTRVFLLPLGKVPCGLACLMNFPYAVVEHQAEENGRLSGERKVMGVGHWLCFWLPINLYLLHGQLLLGRRRWQYDWLYLWVPMDTCPRGWPLPISLPGKLVLLYQ